MHRFDATFTVTKKRLRAVSCADGGGFATDVPRLRLASARWLRQLRAIGRLPDQRAHLSRRRPAALGGARADEPGARGCRVVTERRRANDSTPQREVAGIFVAMRVSTGEIVSYTGRHGRTAAGADLLRIGRIQPASAIKPLLLAAALDDGNMYLDETLGELMGSHCPDPKVHEYLATLSGVRRAGTHASPRRCCEATTCSVRA